MLAELDHCAVTLYCKWDSWISIVSLVDLVMDGTEACLLGNPAYGAIARQEARTLQTLILVARGVYTVVDGLSDPGEWLLILLMDNAKTRVGGLPLPNTRLPSAARRLICETVKKFQVFNWVVSGGPSVR